FSMLQLGERDSAQRYLDKISNVVGRDPYATAKHGLYHLAKGEVVEGVGRYRQAISIAYDRSLKDRIRQRMHFELGKHYLHVNREDKARVNFERAMAQKYGFEFVAEQARREIERIARRLQ